MLNLLSAPTGVIRFPIDQNLQKGDVVQLLENNGQISLSKSNGIAPLGILSKKVRVLNKKTRAVKRLVGEVVFCRCILQTDNYDAQQKYKLGDKLFINKDGKFTSDQPSSEYPYIGWVSACPTVDNSFLQLMWL